MLRLLYTSFTFAIVGVFSGLFYRELTKAHDFTDRSATQLPLVHTHFLVLGFMVLLIVMVLERVFHLSAAAPKLNTWFYWIWTIGVLVTGGMMLVKGTLAVLGSDASSPALAGIAGMGHMLLTAGIVLLFLALRKAVVAAVPAQHALVAA
ncbi:DUF2871 domain-containing protein [Arthrobacter sp.]|uniref:DUF2871 domain-containing protein n=1 Tax=Arthrobacter sp. TaxID=1667 RepID=UPI003A8DD107